jgi:hypothetical protein
MIFCLFQMENFDNTKMHLMIHKPEWKDKSFFEMAS